MNFSMVYAAIIATICIGCIHSSSFRQSRSSREFECFALATRTCPQPAFLGDSHSDQSMMETLRGAPLEEGCGQLKDYLDCQINTLNQENCREYPSVTEGLSKLNIYSNIVDIVCDQEFDALQENWECYTSEEFDKDFNKCAVRHIQWMRCDMKKFWKCVELAVHRVGDCEHGATRLLQKVMPQFLQASGQCDNKSLFSILKK